MPLPPNPVTDATPPFPEAALRAVLAGAVAAWAGAQSDPSSAGDEPRRLYLDAFAGAEFQFGTGVARSGDEETRAAAAFRALHQAAAESPPNAVFVEEDPAHLGRIYAGLEDPAGGERLRATKHLASLQPGEISLLEAPFAAVAADVARYAAGARTFALLAPPAARALPWDALRPMAAQPDATLLIRLPHSDWEKQSRHTGPLADLPAFARRIVEGCSTLLDDPKHAWLPAWRAEAAASGPAAAFASVLERFRALLDGVAAGRILKPMELEAADGARTWLFLLTPDPAVALAANAAVHAARLIDRAAAPSRVTASPPVTSPAAAASSDTAPSVAGSAPGTPDEASAVIPAKKKSRRGAASSPATPAAIPAPPPPAPDPAWDEAAAGEVDQSESPGTAATSDLPPSTTPAAPPPSDASAGVIRPAAPRADPQPVAEFLDLFPEQIAQPEYLLPIRPDPAELAATIEARFAGTTVAWRDLLRACAATDATPAELKAALAVLRRGGRATYKALKGDDDPIEFPAEPIARDNPPRDKPKRRKKAGDDGGWFGDGG